MWFNIIPSYAIIVASLGIPAYATYWLHYLVLGNHYRRTLEQRWERHLYTRDVRLTGSPYKMQGLDVFPTLTERQLLWRAEQQAIEREKRKEMVAKKKQKKLEEKIARIIGDDE